MKCKRFYQQTQSLHQYTVVHGIVSETRMPYAHFVSSHVVLSAFKCKRTFNSLQEWKGEKKYTRLAFMIASSIRSNPCSWFLLFSIIFSDCSDHLSPKATMFSVIPASPWNLSYLSDVNRQICPELELNSQLWSTDITFILKKATLFGMLQKHQETTFQHHITTLLPSIKNKNTRGMQTKIPSEMVIQQNTVSSTLPYLAVEAWMKWIISLRSFLFFLDNLFKTVLMVPVSSPIDTQA